jgi:hypothetical protein
MAGVHYGQIDAEHAARQVTLDQAFRENPGRFVKKSANATQQTDRRMDQSVDAEKQCLTDGLRFL